MWKSKYKQNLPKESPDVMYFGMHKGKNIKDIPKQYRTWLLVDYQGELRKDFKQRLVWLNMEENGENLKSFLEM
jgi:hypothetical protein